MSGMEKTPDKLRDKAVPLAPFLDILECPVCLEVVKIPFKQCQRGHLICNACAEPLPHCPSCKSTFIALDSPVCIKQLLEALPRMCRYSRAGCEEIVEPNSDHELYCGYRPVECKRCKQETLVRQLKQHLADVHAIWPLFQQLGLIQLENYLQGKTGQYIVSIFRMDTLFWLTIIMNTDEIEIRFEGVFSCKPTDDYYITLKFEKDNVGPRVSLKASENPNNLHEEEDICTTKIFRRTVRRCIRDQVKLAFYYELCAKPKSPTKVKRLDFIPSKHYMCY